MATAVTPGGRHTAEYLDTQSFTAHVCACGAYVAASSQVTSSPVTRTTGTPYSAATSAFSRPSLACSPFTRTPVIELGR